MKHMETSEQLLLGNQPVRCLMQAGTDRIVDDLIKRFNGKQNRKT